MWLCWEERRAREISGRFCATPITAVLCWYVLTATPHTSASGLAVSWSALCIRWGGSLCWRESFGGLCILGGLQWAFELGGLGRFCSFRLRCRGL